MSTLSPELVETARANYARPTELEVDDLFMMKLRDTRADVTGCFAFTEIGLVDDEGTFHPSASMLKMQDYRVPNTLHEIYLSREGCNSMPPGYTVERVVKSLAPTVQWLNDNVVGDHGGKPRILVNIVDGCDAFAENTFQVLEVLQLLAGLPIEGVSVEDDRGTFMPFQVGKYVALARQALPPPLKLLVHMHAGAGFENASVIEALLNGADGAWGGLPKRAAIIGHASLGELIANLMRIGNTKVETTYRVEGLWPLATELQQLDDGERIPEDLPILGTNAYRVTLEFFRQISTRYMDLVPERIGAPAGYRICPLGSDDPIGACRGQRTARLIAPRQRRRRPKRMAAMMMMAKSPTLPPP